MTLQFVGEYRILQMKRLTSEWSGSSFLLGPNENEAITSMAMEGKSLWAAAGSDVIKYLRGKEVCLYLPVEDVFPACLMTSKVMRLTNPLATPLVSILIFGTQLLALSEDGSRLFVWSTEDGSAYKCFVVYIQYPHIGA